METLINMTSQRGENPFIQKIPSATSAPAALSARVSAFLVDYIALLLILGAAILIASPFKSSFPGFASYLVLAGYLAAAGFAIWNWGFRVLREGQRFGQSLVGIRTVREDGRQLDLKTVLMRNLAGYLLSLACLGLGFIWVLFDRRHRGWHDRLAGTVVIDSPGE